MRCPGQGAAEDTYRTVPVCPEWGGGVCVTVALGPLAKGRARLGWRQLSPTKKRWEENEPSSFCL